MNYAAAAEILGTRDHKKVANNTILHRIDESTIGLRLHNTDVLVYRPGSVAYYTGGWRTVTTKSRFNKFGVDGLRVYSDKGTWKVYRNGEPVDLFVEGYMWREDVEGAPEPENRYVNRFNPGHPECVLPLPVAMTPYEAVGMAEGFVDCPDEETYYAAFQYLIDTGMAWTLQGWFGRTAAGMIESGVCHKA